MFKFIKQAVLAMVADDVKSMVDAAVKAAVDAHRVSPEAVAKALVVEDLLDMDGIVMDAAERAVDDIDTDDIASRVDVDYDDLARSLDASDVAACIDLSDLAGEVDLSEVAESIDVERVADALDYRRLAAMILERRAEQARAAKALRAEASTNG